MHILKCYIVISEVGLYGSQQSIAMDCTKVLIGTTFFWTVIHPKKPYVVWYHVLYIQNLKFLL